MQCFRLKAALAFGVVDDRLRYTALNAGNTAGLSARCLRCYTSAVEEANMGHKLHHSGDIYSGPRLAMRRGFLSSLISATVLAPWAFSQERAQTDMAERFRQMSEEFEEKGLAAPFRGITTDGKAIPGLFEISPSGVSTEPVRNAAEKFIASLTSVQLTRTMFPVDDIQWRKWMNQHFYTRQGISFQEMTDGQRDAAFGLYARIAERERAFELTRNVMRLNETPQWR